MASQAQHSEEKEICVIHCEQKPFPPSRVPAQARSRRHPRHPAEDIVSPAVAQQTLTKGLAFGTAFSKLLKFTSREGENDEECEICRSSYFVFSLFNRQITIVFSLLFA